jgi:hypothetical protein
VHPLVALALVILAGIGATYLSRSRFPVRPALLNDLLATGVLFLLLGLLLRQGLGVVDFAGWRDLQPLLALAIGWIGATFGARLEWRMIRRVSRRTWVVGATLALPILVVTTVMAWLLARALPSLAQSWGRPTLVVALALGGALTTAASHRGPRLGRRNALLDTTFGVAAMATAVALAPPHAPVRSIVLTLVGSGALGGLFVLAARTLADPRDAGLAAVALLLAGAGFSFAAGLSPFVVCALEAAIVMSFAPTPVRRTVAELLARWEVPLYATFLIIAGGLLRPITPWVILAAVVLAFIRVAVR